MWWWRERIGNREFGFTDRWGGNSAGAHSQLNLSLRTGDNSSIVEHNRKTLATDLGTSGFVTVHQVHGADVVHVNNYEQHVGDGLVTSTPDLALMVMNADCVPLLIVSSARVGAFHIGRQGLAAGMTAQAIKEFVHDDDVVAALGPYACGQCYEVPPDMADEISEQFPTARTTTRRGTAGLDIGAAIRHELKQHDITILDTPDDFCTIEHERFFSYRSKGRDKGRQTGVVMIHDT